VEHVVYECKKLFGATDFLAMDAVGKDGTLKHACPASIRKAINMLKLYFFIFILILRLNPRQLTFLFEEAFT